MVWVPSKKEIEIEHRARAICDDCRFAPGKYVFLTPCRTCHEKVRKEMEAEKV